MSLTPAEASTWFGRFPPHLQAPALHPGYVVADAARSSELSPVFFTYTEGGEIYYHAFHLAEVPGAPYRDIQSPYGYGGPISSSDDAQFLAAAWTAYAAWCQEQKVLAEFVRFHPLLDNARFFPGEVMDDRETVWIDLAQAELLASYEVRARTAVRKAIKQGLHVAWLPASQVEQVFPPIYHAAMAALGADQFYFFPEPYFRHLADWDWLHLAICRLDEEIVATALFLVGPQWMEYHLSASSEKGKKLGATNLLIHEAALWGQSQGCAGLHLGGGANADPKNPLLFFKTGFSNRRASFRIGKKIHRPAAYLEMKTQWQAQTGRVSNRVLFYRES